MPSHNYISFFKALIIERITKTILQSVIIILGDYLTYVPVIGHAKCQTEIPVRKRDEEKAIRKWNIEEQEITTCSLLNFVENGIVF